MAYDFEVEQMDMKTVFIHGDLKEEIYMSQPENFVAKGKENLVCKLKKPPHGSNVVSKVRHPYVVLGISEILMLLLCIL